jgi:hypothetical protein
VQNLLGAVLAYIYIYIYKDKSTIVNENVKKVPIYIYTI